jgi:hypothetical protein
MRTFARATLAAVAASMLTQATPVGAQDARWRMAKPLPQPLGEIVSTVIGKKWYVFGGYDGANVQPQGVVLEYDAAAETWTAKKNMLIPAHHAAAVALDGKIYVFGGFVGRPGARVWQPIVSALVYDPAADSWKELAPMPTPRGSAAAVVVDGKIYVIGGAHANIPGKPGTEPLAVGVPPSAAVPQIVTGAVTLPPTLGASAPRCRPAATISSLRWSTARSTRSTAGSAHRLSAPATSPTSSKNTIPRPTSGGTWGARRPSAATWRAPFTTARSMSPAVNMRNRAVR